MKQDRRDFLGTVAAAGLLGAGTGSRAPDHPPDPDFPTTAPDAAVPFSSDWDLSWTAKLTGQHRAVFDWYQPRASAGVWRAGIWKQQVVETFGVKAGEVSSVLVIRHSAIPMIMSNPFWQRHKLGKLRKLKDDSGKTAEANPHLKTIDEFLKTDGIVLACGFAFGAMVSLEAKRQNKPEKEIRPEVLKDVIPGIIIQPSGFFALLEAQRNGCALFPADVLLPE